MGLLKNRIIKMGCDFWIDTEEDAPSVVTRMPGIQPSWATTKGAIFRTSPHTAIPGKVIPGKFFKQNLWELSGTAYFEKDDHLIPFKSIDMLEMIEKQKSSSGTTITNASFISAMSTGINFNSVFHRNCGDVSHRTDCWSTSTCTCSVTARKITLTESRPELKWAVHSISRPERMTRVSLPSRPEYPPPESNGKDTPTYPTPSSALTRSSMRKMSGFTTRSTTEKHRNTSIWYINPTKYWT